MSGCCIVPDWFTINFRNRNIVCAHPVNIWAMYMTAQNKHYSFKTTPILLYVIQQATIVILHTSWTQSCKSQYCFLNVNGPANPRKNQKMHLQFTVWQKCVSTFALTRRRLNLANNLYIYCVNYTLNQNMPVTVAARSKAWNVFARSNTRTVGSNPTKGMNVSVRLLRVFTVLWAGSDLVTGWSTVQGVLLTA
jgi:hypothetical protein